MQPEQQCCSQLSAPEKQAGTAAVPSKGRSECISQLLSELIQSSSLSSFWGLLLGCAKTQSLQVQLWGWQCGVPVLLWGQQRHRLWGEWSPLLLSGNRSPQVQESGTCISLGWQALESSFVWEPARNEWMKSGRFLALSHLYPNMLHLSSLVCPTLRDLGGADSSTSPEPTEPRADPGPAGDHPPTATTDGKSALGAPRHAHVYVLML